MNISKKKRLFWAMSLMLLLLGGCDNSTAVNQTAAQNDKAVDNTTAQATEPANKKTMPEVVMYKSPNCECCTGWAEHLSKNGFTVIEHKRDDMDAIKSKYGVTDKLASCHTAIVDGYVIEGHVPAADVERLLKERPDVVGLTAPGMPMKSPGMQSVGQTPKGYDVLAFDHDGKSHVFTHY
ncbi:MAG: DUF411 domain-containing protein [Mariprofundus sp.]|nr:DUF411 domain-containing protein [Mariprofundus sp.]